MLSVLTLSDIELHEIIVVVLGVTVVVVATIAFVFYRWAIKQVNDIFTVSHGFAYRGRQWSNGSWFYKAMISRPHPKLLECLWGRTNSPDTASHHGQRPPTHPHLCVPVAWHRKDKKSQIWPWLLRSADGKSRRVNSPPVRATLFTSKQATISSEMASIRFIHSSLSDESFCSILLDFP